MQRHKPVYNTFDPTRAIRLGDFVFRGQVRCLTADDSFNICPIDGFHYPTIELLDVIRSQTDRLTPDGRVWLEKYGR